MLRGLSVASILEVGCNRGHNLQALRQVLGDSVRLTGIEVNRLAGEMARALSGETILVADAAALPFEDAAFDLVFTAGVLIHVAPEDLAIVLQEIHRVARRYVLAIEYFAETETPITYRGRDGLLWKRDYLACYGARFPEIELVDHGFWGPEDGFDRAHWWLLAR